MRVRFDSEFDADVFNAILVRHTGRRQIPVVAEEDLNKPRPCYYVHTPDNWLGHYIELLKVAFDYPWFRWWEVLDRVLHEHTFHTLDHTSSIPTPRLARYAWDAVAWRVGVDGDAIDSADRLGGLVTVSEMVSQAAKEYRP